MKKKTLQPAAYSPSRSRPRAVAAQTHEKPSYPTFGELDGTAKGALSEMLRSFLRPIAVGAVGLAVGCGSPPPPPTRLGGAVAPVSPESQGLHITPPIETGQPDTTLGVPGGPLRPTDTGVEDDRPQPSPPPPDRPLPPCPLPPPPPPGPSPRPDPPPMPGGISAVRP